MDTYGYYGYDGSLVDTSSSANTFGTIGVIIGVVSLIIGILMIISMIKIFKKAGKPGWAIFIPIYNTIVMLQIANMPAWNIILLLIPIVNIYITYKMYAGISKVCGKSNGFAIATLFFPVICLPILAFSKQKTGESEKQTSSNGEYTFENQQDNDLEKISDMMKPEESQMDQDLFNQQPMMQNTYDQQPMTQNTYDQQPMTQNTYDQQPMMQNTYDQQPMTQNTYDQQPMMQNTYDQQPMTQNTYDQQPMTQNTYDNQEKNSEFIECPNCHTKIKSDSPICFMCGTKLS